MAKKKSRKPKSNKNTTVEELKKASPAFKINEKNQTYIFLALITIIMLILLKPMVIDGLSPQGVDVLSSISVNHKVQEWQEKTGEYALWNPYIFSGMPRYQRYSPVTWSVDTILIKLGSLLNNVFIYYLFAGFGMFFFLRYLKMSPLVSFFGAIAFILMPHYKSLFITGHLAKFRALMMLPWICYSLLYFLEKRSLLSAALFALAFGLQVRTQHYQIVFYTAILIFAITIYPMVKDLLGKQYKRFAKSAVLIIVAVTLAILTAAQPLFLAKEYLPWSKRGKTTIDISAPEKTEGIAKTDGVSMDYATGWSTAPSEIITWAVPRYFGGMSGEKYTGDAVPQLKGHEFPGYWGEMPFTQSYEYMGAITLLLAIIGLVYNRKNKFVVSLAIFAGFLTLLSFGRHAQWFYSIFYDYVPFFNKFRAPMMSVTVTFFIVSLLAAFGLSSIATIKKSIDIKENKTLFIILGSFIGMGLLLWLFGQGLSFAKVGESYGDPRYLELFKTARLEMLNSDMLRYMALILMSVVAIYVYIRGKLKLGAFTFLIIVISLIDLINIQGRIEKKFINREALEHNYFRTLDTDKAIFKDKGLFRVFPLGQNFGDNRWAYYHQTLGGYSPIKMFTIEEFITNNINNGNFANRNIMKILNVKYLISKNVLRDQDLTLFHSDNQQKLYTYLYNDNQQRGFFVGQYRKIEDEFNRLSELNNPQFKPDSIALIEEDLPQEIYYPDSSKVTVTLFNPNQTHFDVYTDKQSLFVISELFYPPGWKIYLDGKQVDKVYKTDHAVQSIIVPAGEHKIEANFDPDSFSNDIQLATGSLGIIYLVILSSLVKLFLDARRSESN